MLVEISCEPGVPPLREIAFAWVWAGADRQADAIYADIEAREDAYSYDATDNVVTFPRQ